ncbi:dTDP-4-dehydrorhamnose reductase [bacterium]|nr:dTDP-4-dehydrorhamnose reductase [bacterium]NIO73596.1 dTDP-4-dehydrorhamnose reductase [bacterium]
MRIMISGACGMLGRDLVEVLSEGHELYLLDVVKFPSSLSSRFSTLTVDITDSAKTYAEVTKMNPDIVIHTAAYTDVDGCETDRDKAFRVNALGTRNIAVACQRFDTELLYLSTDYVFDGEKGEPYLEFDKPNPQSIYGKSKYWGELYIESLLNRFYIVRSSWLFGKNGKNFVTTILNLAKQEKEIEVVNDQIGSPTYTKDLARAIAQLIGGEGKDSITRASLYGIWHITNSGQCSWYEFAGEILQNSDVRLKPITSEKLNRPAKRPRFSVLENSVRKLQGWKSLRHWKEALEDYLKEIR